MCSAETTSAPVVPTESATSSIDSTTPTATQVSTTSGENNVQTTSASTTPGSWMFSFKSRYTYILFQ